MQDTILVTGATGTVGSQVVRELSNYEGHVRAGVHSIIKGEKLKQYPDTSIVELDCNRPETFEAAFTGVTKLFLLTPFAEDQVEMAKHLVDAAKKAGVKHIVRLSASGAGSENGIQLGRWHREAEQYIEQSGIAYTFLRPASYMQNFVNYMAHTIANEGKIYMPLGEGKVNYIDVRDIGAVAAVTLTQPGHENKVYELTGPEALSIKEIAEIISEELGKQVEYIDVPEDAARQSMLQAHMPEKLVSAMLELYAVAKAGHTATVNDTVHKITGRQPHTFREFVRDCHKQFEPHA
ncbi:MAG: SDR family oxidoreductase [Hymenobacteraceae bacterium]|nr:SDR family oxidoreductase [Hymenobacteraceae bacterium]MDX5397060.1 SDR family oxidoreductase [Hymenobacteraceae bacterium]MDX5513130.1 SDR family oxidoreductase [Hymenobacteraceae bacterium]